MAQSGQLSAHLKQSLGIPFGNGHALPDFASSQHCPPRVRNQAVTPGTPPVLVQTTLRGSHGPASKMIKAPAAGKANNNQAKSNMRTLRNQGAGHVTNVT